MFSQSRRRLVSVASTAALALLLSAQAADAQCRGGQQPSALRTAPPQQSALQTALQQQNALLLAILQQQQNAQLMARQPPNVLQRQNGAAAEPRPDRQAEDLFADPAKQAGNVVRLQGTLAKLTDQQGELNTSAGPVAVSFRERPIRLRQLLEKDPDVVVVVEGTVRVKEGRPVLTRARFLRTVTPKEVAKRLGA
jgi:hypothetical protein